MILTFYSHKVCVPHPISYRHDVPLNGHQISCTLKDLLNICLLREHEPLCLVSHLGEAPPAFKILRLPLIAVCFPGMLPMTL